MKRILLIASILFTSLLNAQSFKFTPNGYVNADDETKTFIVLNFDNLPKEELYKRVLIYVNRSFVSPKDVVSKVENESININTVFNNAIKRNAVHKFDANVSLALTFKDDKIRIDAPNIILTSYQFNKKQVLHFSNSKGEISINGDDLFIYGKNGNVKSERAEKDLNLFSTFLVDLIKKSVSDSNNDW